MKALFNRRQLSQIYKIISLVKILIKPYSIKRNHYLFIILINLRKNNRFYLVESEGQGNLVFFFTFDQLDYRILCIILILDCQRGLLKLGLLWLFEDNLVGFIGLRLGFINDNIMSNNSKISDTILRNLYNIRNQNGPIYKVILDIKFTVFIWKVKKNLVLKIRVLISRESSL